MYSTKNQVKFSKTNIFDYVYKKNVFSKDFCSEKIHQLNQLDASEWQPHLWGTTYDYQKRANMEDFSTTYQLKIHEDMIDDIGKFLLDYQKNTSRFFQISQISPIRFNKYDIGQEMLEHVDHIYGLFDGEKKGIPVISILGVLNDDYEGGDFWLCGEKIKLNIGDILVFPSVFLYPHKVSSVTSGSRYSWISWGY